jgi:hypothetical protein
MTLILNLAYHSSPTSVHMFSRLNVQYSLYVAMSSQAIVSSSLVPIFLNYFILNLH